MATITIYLIAAMSIILFLKETNNSCKQGYIIADCIDIHCEIQATAFALQARSLLTHICLKSERPA